MPSMMECDWFIQMAFLSNRSKTGIVESKIRTDSSHECALQLILVQRLRLRLMETPIEHSHSAQTRVNSLKQKGLHQTWTSRTPIVLHMLVNGLAYLQELLWNAYRLNDAYTQWLLLTYWIWSSMIMKLLPGKYHHN